MPTVLKEGGFPIGKRHYFYNFSTQRFLFCSGAIPSQNKSARVKNDRQFFRVTVRQKSARECKFTRINLCFVIVSKRKYPSQISQL